MDSDEWYGFDLDKPQPKKYITFDILKSYDKIQHIFTKITFSKKSESKTNFFVKQYFLSKCKLKNYYVKNLGSELNNTYMHKEEKLIINRKFKDIIYFNVISYIIKR